MKCGSLLKPFNRVLFSLDFNGNSTITIRALISTRKMTPLIANGNCTTILRARPHFRSPVLGCGWATELFAGPVNYD